MFHRFFFLPCLASLAIFSIQTVIPVFPIGTRIALRSLDAFSSRTDTSSFTSWTPFAFLAFQASFASRRFEVHPMFGIVLRLFSSSFDWFGANIHHIMLFLRLFIFNRNKYVIAFFILFTHFPPC